jgi:hypothetical protein
MGSELIKKRFQALSPFLDERLRRVLAAAEAKAIGHGGISIVSRQTGVSRRAIAIGCEALNNPETGDKRRIRKKGGGRKRAIDKDSKLKKHLDGLIEPYENADESALRWTCKSVRKLSAELKQMGHRASYNLVAGLLHEMGYTLRGNQKILADLSYRDRDAQFAYINKKAREYQRMGEPVIFVVTKKHKLKSGTGKLAADTFIDQGWEKRLFDLYTMGAWEPAEIDAETFVFAAEGIRRWYDTMGSVKLQKPKRLLIVIEISGCGDNALNIWKSQIQALVSETGVCVSVSYFPPGTSKWNKIERRLVSLSILEYGGQCLVSQRVLVSLVADALYAEDIAVFNEASTRMKVDGFHKRWNYTIRP